MGKVNTSGPTECHTKVYKDRRNAILHRYAALGIGLPAEQRNNLVLFMEQWDRNGVDLHGNEWPEKFFSKLQGVLDQVEKDPCAFSKFMRAEESLVFSGTHALLVPGRPGAIRALADCV